MGYFGIVANVNIYISFYCEKAHLFRCAKTRSYATTVKFTNTSIFDNSESGFFAGNNRYTVSFFEKITFWKSTAYGDSATNEHLYVSTFYGSFSCSRNLPRSSCISRDIFNVAIRTEIDDQLRVPYYLIGGRMPWVCSIAV